MWKGGDPECKHTTGKQVPDSKYKEAIVAGVRPGADASTCAKCGAVRVDKQLGLEPVHDCCGWATGVWCTECYVCHIVGVFNEVKRVLRKDGTLWLVMGDSYMSSAGKRTYGSSDGGVWRGNAPGPRLTAVGLKPKDLVGIPWRVAFALQASGWYLRSPIVWAKAISF